MLKAELGVSDTFWEIERCGAIQVSVNIYITWIYVNICRELFGEVCMVTYCISSEGYLATIKYKQQILQLIIRVSFFDKINWQWHCNCRHVQRRDFETDLTVVTVTSVLSCGRWHDGQLGHSTWPALLVQKGQHTFAFHSSPNKCSVGHTKALSVGHRHGNEQIAILAD